MEIQNLTGVPVTLSLHLSDGSVGEIKVPAHQEKIRIPKLPCDPTTAIWSTSSEKRREASICREQDGRLVVTLRSSLQEKAQIFERRHSQPTILPEPDLSISGPRDPSDPRLHDLVKRLSSTKEKFVDGYFPNERLQGVRNLTQHIIEFHRPNVVINRPICFPETCPESGGAKCDLHQGALGDCWVIATLAVMYCHDVGLIRKMFVMVKPEIGLYVLRFMKFGKPIYVLVDDRLPFSGSQLAFASHADKSTLWGSILEKAYAKLLGGYHNLVGGKISDALMDFTGHAAKSINMSRNRQNVAQTLERVSSLHKMNGLTELLGCSVRGTRGNGENEEKLSNGLYAGHAYAILLFQEVSVRLNKSSSKKERVPLVELMNPWGKNTWNGAFGKNSNIWTLNPELAKTLKYEPNGGTFWMQLKDFANVFDRIEGVLYYVDQLHHSQKICSSLRMKSVSGMWTAKSSGGAQGATWNQNPQFHISYRKEMGARSMFSVYLLQQDMNWQFSKGIVSRKALNSIGVQVWRAGEGKSRLEMMFAKYSTNPRICSQYSKSRSVYENFSSLPAGEYILIPTTYNPGRHGSFIMLIYTNEEIEITALESTASTQSKIKSFGKTMTFTNDSFMSKKKVEVKTTTSSTSFSRVPPVFPRPSSRPVLAPPSHPVLPPRSRPVLPPPSRPVLPPPSRPVFPPPSRPVTQQQRQRQEAPLPASKPSFLDRDFDNTALKRKQDHRERAWPVPPLDAIESKVELVQDITVAEDFDEKLTKSSKIPHQCRSTRTMIDRSRPDREIVIEDCPILENEENQFTNSDTAPQRSEISSKLSSSDHSDITTIRGDRRTQIYDAIDSLFDSVKERRPSLGPSVSSRSHRVKSMTEIEPEDILYLQKEASAPFRLEEDERIMTTTETLQFQQGELSDKLTDAVKLRKIEPDSRMKIDDVVENLNFDQQRRPSWGPRASMVAHDLRVKSSMELEAENIDSKSSNISPSLLLIEGNLKQRRPSRGPEMSTHKNRSESLIEYKIENEDIRYVQDEIVAPSLLVQDEDVSSEPSFETRGKISTRFEISKEYARQDADKTANAIREDAPIRISEENSRRPSFGPDASNTLPDELVRFVEFHKTNSDAETGCENSPARLSDKITTALPSSAPLAGIRAFSSLRSERNCAVDSDPESKSVSHRRRRRLSAASQLERAVYDSLGFNRAHSDTSSYLKERSKFYKLIQKKEICSGKTTTHNEKYVEKKSSSSPSNTTTTTTKSLDQKIQEYIQLRRQLRKPSRNSMMIRKSILDEEEEDKNLERRISRVKRAVKYVRNEYDD